MISAPCWPAGGHYLVPQILQGHLSYRYHFLKRLLLNAWGGTQLFPDAAHDHWENEPRKYFFGCGYPAPCSTRLKRFVPGTCVVSDTGHCEPGRVYQQKLLEPYELRTRRSHVYIAIYMRAYITRSISTHLAQYFTSTTWEFSYNTNTGYATVVDIQNDV